MEQGTQETVSPVDAYESIFVPAMLDPLARITLDRTGLKAGEHLIDLACGSGIIARNAAPLLGETGSVIAIDISPKMLAKARELPAPGGARIDWCEAGASGLPVEDGSADVLICQQGLQYFDQPEAALAECLRVLRPGGRILLSTWRDLGHAPLFEALVAVEARHLGPLGVTYEELAAPFRMDDAEALRRLLREAGFGDVAVEEVAVPARFPSAERFVADVEIAYASIMPQFVEDPAAFRAFVASVEREMRGTIEHFRDGEGLRCPMAANLLAGRR